MEAIIIDIKKELRNIPDNRDVWSVVERPGLTSMVMDVGTTPDYMVTSSRIDYLRMRIKHPEKEELLNYFVRADDRGLFNDLIAVSNGFMEEKLTKEFEKGLVIGRTDLWSEVQTEIVPTALKKQRNKIKSLSWYDRLFKKF